MLLLKEKRSDKLSSYFISIWLGSLPQNKEILAHDLEKGSQQLQNLWQTTLFYIEEE